MKIDHTFPEQSQHGALNGTCSSFSLDIISYACLLPGFGNTSLAKLSYNLVRCRHTAGGLLPFDKISAKKNIKIVKLHYFLM